MQLKNFLLLLATGIIFSTGCKKDSGLTPEIEKPEDGNKPPVIGAPTVIGKPVGNAVTKTIGPAGGTITLPYNKPDEPNSTGVAEVNFPQGCFDKNVQVSVQPIENMCHNGNGPAFRLSSNDPNVAMNKLADLILSEDATPPPNAPEVYISMQDPIKKLWRAGRGTKDAVTGKRKYKIHRLADWALFENYHLKIYDEDKLAKIEDAVNGPHISLITSQPVRLEVYRLVPNETKIELSGNESLMIALPYPVNIVNDKIDAIKWKFNGEVISESNNVPGQTPLGYFVFEGGKFETLRYTAPLVVPGDGSAPLDVRIEAEVRGSNNGPMAILIQRFRITNPNEYKLNGRSVKNAYAEAEATLGFLTFSIKKATDLLDEENLTFSSFSEVKPQAYPLTKETEESNLLTATTSKPLRTWSHTYVDAEGNEHFSGGNFTITQIKEFSDYKIYIGTLSSSLYIYNNETKKLSSISASATFEAVDRPK